MDLLVGTTLKHRRAHHFNQICHTLCIYLDIYVSTKHYEMQQPAVRYIFMFQFDVKHIDSLMYLI